MLRSTLRLVLPMLLVLLGLAAPSGAATVVANGKHPDAITDRDGVTHLVWNESRPGAGDLLHYCRIPRGATACQNAITRSPVVAGDAQTSDSEGPKVVINGFGRVILLTNRDFKTVSYTSEDDGLTFEAGPGTILGGVGSAYTGDGTPSVYDTAGERIVTIAGPTGGVRLRAAPRTGSNTTNYAQLSNYDSYYPSVAFRGPDSFAAAWSDLNYTTHVRTFACTGCDPNDASKWTPDVAIPNADEPRVTTGPNGTFVLYRDMAQGSPDYRRYFLRRIDGATVGPALAVSDAQGNNMRDIVEDAGGLLHVLYTDEDNGLTYRASKTGGASWGPRQLIAPGPDFTIDNIRVTARTVDEGFTGLALWESNDNGTQNPPILMAALPDVSVSLADVVPAVPGLPSAPGTAPPAPEAPAACRLLTFAAVDVIADACLKKEGDAYVATGGLKINGLRVELGSGKLRLDPKKRTITSSGATVTVKVGDTVVFKHAIDWTLPKGSTASLGAIDVSGGGDLLGFPLKGSIDVKFKGGGVELPVHLGLPALFGGVTGDVTVRADNVAGVHLRELHVKVGDALIGPLEIKDLFFDYDAEKVSWQGGANVILPPQPPGPSIESKIAFSHGELDSLSAEATLPPNIFLDPFLVTQLKKIRFSLQTKPTLQLKGGITVDAGPQVAGVSAVSVDGDLTFTLGDPITLRIDGRLNVVSIPLATAYFELRTNGYIALGGHLGYAFSGFSATADVTGFLYKTTFSLGAGAQVCLGDLGCAGGETVFSSIGFAACVKTFIADFGAGYKWGEGLDIMFSGCDVGPYKATASAAQAGPGARTLSFGKGVPSGFVAVSGQGAPPHVALVGPGGARIEDTPGAKAETASAIAFHNPETNTTYFVLKAPAAGTWTVEPLAGSAPVSGVQAADGLDDPKVTGRVQRGPGATRVLSYAVAPRPGQKVTFAEQGKGAAKPIGGTAREGRGTLRFTPADGPGGTRKIIALVSSYGKPRAQLTVTRYVAPPPARPATVKRLRARRASTRLVVSWASAKNAKRYELRATLSDGRRLLVRQKGRTYAIPAFAARARATITVVGLKADGTRGRKATVKVTAKQAKQKTAKRK